MLISFVVPVYFEEETLLKELCERIAKIGRKIKFNYEIIFVNDDGTEKTLSLLKKLHQKNSKVKILSFSRNFGHQVAILAGLRHSSGDLTVVMDSDLQDPPELIPEMVNKWREGYQIVYGQRIERDEPFWKNVGYKIFYRLLAKVSYYKNIPVDAGLFSLMDKQAVKEICRLKEDRPYLRGLRAWVGFRQTGVLYKRPPRKAGHSQYGLVKLTSLAIDGLISFSPIALRIMLVTGLFISFLSISYAFYIGINRIFIYFNIIDASNLVPGWATLVCGFLFLMGLQFIFLAILGEYIGRVYLEIKNRPPYIIKEKIGLKDENL